MLYSESWKLEKTFLYYKSPSYNFHNYLYVVDLEDCLINYKSISKAYKEEFKIEIFSKDLIRKLINNSHNHNTVIISNQICPNKRNIDFIKKRIEQFIETTNLPLLCLFALKPNFYMKPHTGLFKVLKYIYKKAGVTLKNVNINIISNEGGLYDEETNQYTTDIDRAFANNIGCKYLSINEFLGYNDNLKFKWGSKIIVPEVRKEIIDKINKNYTADILEKILSNKTDFYVILVTGPPRSGKTRLCKDIIKLWNNHEINKTSTLEFIDSSVTKSKRINCFKKFTDDRISVLIDGNCHTNELQEPFIKHLSKNKKINHIIMIDIYIGMFISKLFNHIHLEVTKSPNTLLYKDKDYDIYNSMKEINKNIKCLKYIPKIVSNSTIENYRF